MAPSPSSSTLVACATVTVTSAAALLLLLHHHHHRSRKDTTTVSINSKEDSTCRSNITVSCSNTTPTSIAADTAANYVDDKLVGLSVSLLDNSSNNNGEEQESQQQQQRRILSRGTITIVYASTTGTCASFATRLHHRLLQLINSSITSSSI